MDSDSLVSLGAIEHLVHFLFPVWRGDRKIIHCSLFSKKSVINRRVIVDKSREAEKLVSKFRNYRCGNKHNSIHIYMGRVSSVRMGRKKKSLGFKAGSRGSSVSSLACFITLLVTFELLTAWCMTSNRLAAEARYLPTRSDDTQVQVLKDIIRGVSG